MNGSTRTVIPRRHTATRTGKALTWEEDEHLVSGVVVVGHQHCEVCAPWPPLTRLVPKLGLELFQCLVQLILGHQVATVVTQLQRKLAR